MPNIQCHSREKNFSGQRSYKKYIYILIMCTNLNDRQQVDVWFDLYLLQEIQLCQLEKIASNLFLLIQSSRVFCFIGNLQLSLNGSFLVSFFHVIYSREKLCSFSSLNKQSLKKCQDYCRQATFKQRGKKRGKNLNQYVWKLTHT